MEAKFNRLHIRFLALCMMLIIALAANAQQHQTTERLNRTGQVTVNAPKELEKRNNADVGKQQQTTSKDKKVKEKDKKKDKSEEDKLNELDDEMEIGMGIHGEPGIRRGKLVLADAIVDEMMEPILKDIPYQAGDEVAVLINGLGATPLEEQYVMFRRVKQILDEKGISVWHTYVGEYATSMEMAGASISLLRLDDELKGWLAAPADTPFFKQFQL